MNAEPRERTGSGSFSDSLAHLLATAGGLGYAPVVPGTVGSLAGVGLFWVLGESVVLGLITVLLLTGVGIWAATRVEQMTGEHDPARVVVDETAGQFLTLWLVWSFRPVSTGQFSTRELILIGVGFLLFRFFDIVKPVPIRQLERLKEGFGVMADDVMAGIYAGLTLHLLDRWGIL